MSHAHVGVAKSIKNVVPIDFHNVHQLKFIGILLNSITPSI